MTWRVVVVTGAAPYLGGPQTWLPLRHAASEIDFVEVDSLDLDGDLDPQAAADAHFTPALHSADLAIAHFSAAKAVIEILARERPDMPLILDSPLLLTRSSVALSCMRTIVSIPPVSWGLVSFAGAKHQKLCNDRAYVEEQLRVFVGNASNSAALIDEAIARIRDPRSAPIARRTPAFLRYNLTPVDSAADRAVWNRVVFAGSGRLDRKTAQRLPHAVHPGVTGASMIEAPVDVARAIRHLLDRSDR